MDLGLTHKGTLVALLCLWLCRAEMSFISSSNTFVLDDGALCGFKDEKLHQHCKALGGGAAVLTPGERQWQEEASLPFWKRIKPLA